MGKTKTIWQVAMTRMTCSGCGVIYDLTEDYFDLVYRGKKTWYCPNGHTQVYTETSEVRAIAARERAVAEANQAWARVEQEAGRARLAEATARKATKELKAAQRLASGGVCPEPNCHRHFVNLERHMASKHGGVKRT